ncbi:MAG: acetolactate decarboxylase [Burkholderiales bacterium]|nr:acetolactate decarboxylase [Burkholderiales bacterium]
MTCKRFPRRSFVLFGACALVIGVAVAAALPFNFTHFGNFQHMSHTGDTKGQVKLAAVPQAPGTWGVGAIAGLKGEILVHDGKVLVSRGADPEGRTAPAAHGEEAALFASATVKSWIEVLIPREMDQAAVEAFVVEQAKVRGIDIEQPFAFLIDGDFPRLRWHVVTGDRPAGQGGGHDGGRAHLISGMRQFHAPGSSGRLVGIYSGKALAGVVSHEGERFHLHYAGDRTRVSGHVDAYAVAAGALLKLPVE